MVYTSLHKTLIAQWSEILKCKTCMKYPVKSSYSVYYAIKGSVVKKTLKIDRKGGKREEIKEKKKKERRKTLCFYKFETALLALPVIFSTLL